MCKSAWTGFEIRIMWYGFLTFMVVSWSLRRKDLPGVTTLLANCSLPMVDFMVFKFTNLDLSTEVISLEYLVSLSSGRDATIRALSSLMPRKTRSVDGPAVLSCAIGTPKNSQRAMNVYRFLRQVASLLSTKKKSSRIFTRDVMPILFFKIHSYPEENLSMILHDEEQPIGRHLSK